MCLSLFLVTPDFSISSQIVETLFVENKMEDDEEEECSSSQNVLYVSNSENKI